MLLLLLFLSLKLLIQELSGTHYKIAFITTKYTK